MADITGRRGRGGRRPVLSILIGFVLFWLLSEIGFGLILMFVVYAVVWYLGRKQGICAKGLLIGWLIAFALAVIISLLFIGVILLGKLLTPFPPMSGFGGL